MHAMHTGIVLNCCYFFPYVWIYTHRPAWLAQIYQDLAGGVMGLAGPATGATWLLGLCHMFAFFGCDFSYYW